MMNFICQWNWNRTNSNNKRTCRWMGNLERIFDLNKPQAQRKHQSPNAVNIFNGNGLIFYAKARKKNSKWNSSWLFRKTEPENIYTLECVRARTYTTNLHVLYTIITNVPRDHMQIISTLWNDKTGSCLSKYISDCNWSFVGMKLRNVPEFKFCVYRPEKELRVTGSMPAQSISLREL